MGCFFDCFRVRDDQSTNHLVSHSARVKSRGDAASQNRLSSLFLSEEKAGSPCPDQDRFSLDSIHINKGLKDEAKFLKACGTIPETPYEIRKASKKLDNSIQDGDSESSKFHSWLPNKSFTKFQLDNKIDEPLTPVKVCEELGRQSISLEQTPSSCLSNVEHAGKNFASSREESEQGSVSTTSRVEANDTDEVMPPATAEFSAGTTQGRNRSVRFVCDFDAYSSSGLSQNNSSRKFETAGKTNSTVASPTPTPLKLYDEMQTPGTIFPSNLESFGKGKTRVRSQFVYSVPKPIDIFSLSKVAEESDTNQESVEQQYFVEQTKANTSRLDVWAKKGEENSAEKDLKVEASVSLRPEAPPTSNEDNNQNLRALSCKTPHFGRTPGDRPIIGMVAAHWNEEETFHVSPKWWDGNGIPNSTTKYKEDQKVSWHATPFEERLERALSEESFVSQRKRLSGMQMASDENGSETALSQRQYSPKSESVVSF